MTIELGEQDVVAAKMMQGDDVFTLTNPSKLQIKTAPGETLFDETVPRGKSWNVTVFVRIVETDA